MTDVTVRTLEAYLREARRIRRELAGHGVSTPVWFRGHRISSWHLSPTLYRGKVEPYWERELVRDFKLRSGVLLKNSPSNYLEWLYVMRHHRVPTRILDWSESPLVALFFALCEVRKMESACVWVLRPWSLNWLSLGRKSVPTTDLKVLEPYALAEEGDKVVRTVKANLPAAVRPRYAIYRAVGQSGMFTVHGTSTDPIETVCSNKNGDWVRKVKIAPKSCESMFKELYESGVTSSSIFPDLDGLAADLTYRYSIRSVGTVNGSQGSFQVGSRGAAGKRVGSELPAAQRNDADVELFGSIDKSHD